MGCEVCVGGWVGGCVGGRGWVCHSGDANPERVIMTHFIKLWLCHRATRTMVLPSGTAGWIVDRGGPSAESEGDIEDHVFPWWHFAG